MYILDGSPYTLPGTTKTIPGLGLQLEMWQLAVHHMRTGKVPEGWLHANWNFDPFVFDRRTRIPHGITQEELVTAITTTLSDTAKREYALRTRLQGQRTIATFTHLYRRALLAVPVALERYLLEQLTPMQWHTLAHVIAADNEQVQLPSRWTLLDITSTSKDGRWMQRAIRQHITYQLDDQARRKALRRHTALPEKKYVGQRLIKEQ